LTFRNFADQTRGAMRRGKGKHWLAAHSAAESVGQKSESLILVELYNSARTYFSKNL